MTDEEVYLDYLKVSENPEPHELTKNAMIILVGEIRKKEPRIANGTHLFDFFMICDEDDDMDSFYGEDYFD